MADLLVELVGHGDDRGQGGLSFARLANQAVQIDPSDLVRWQDVEPTELV